MTLHHHVISLTMILSFICMVIVSSIMYLIYQEYKSTPQEITIINYTTPITEVEEVTPPPPVVIQESPQIIAIDKFVENPEAFPQVYCLAKNVFFEASIDNLAGKAAVADVTINRVEDSRYPSTICDVVKSGVKDANGNVIKNKCAFSWYCDGKKDDVPKQSKNWKEAMEVAWNIVKNNKFRGISDGATHYHATYVEPYWIESEDMEHVGKIGEHLFYKWR